MSDRWKEDRRDINRVGWFGIRWGILLTLIVTAIVLVFAVVSLTFWKPWVKDQKAEINRNSYQYEQAVRTLVAERIVSIATLRVEVLELEASNGSTALIDGKQAQILAFTREICLRASEVDRDDLTDEGAAFVADNCS